MKGVRQISDKKKQGPQNYCNKAFIERVGKAIITTHLDHCYLSHPQAKQRETIIQNIPSESSSTQDGKSSAPQIYIQYIQYTVYPYILYKIEQHVVECIPGPILAHGEISNRKIRYFLQHGSVQFYNGSGSAFSFRMDPEPGSELPVQYNSSNFNQLIFSSSYLY